MPKLALNPVAGGFSPPAPTAPRMRVRTGRFLRIGKGHRRMTTSNVGYGTGRQRRFTRSGAVRPLRSARLARCRRFGPSPCPPHYGGRWATMPSADFCPHHAQRCRPARCPGYGRVRWPLQCFRPGPQSGSPGHHSPRSVRWRFQPFRTGPQFDSPSGTGRLRDRSPRIRT